VYILSVGTLRTLSLKPELADLVGRHLRSPLARVGVDRDHEELLVARVAPVVRDRHALGLGLQHVALGHLEIAVRARHEVQVGVLLEAARLVEPGDAGRDVAVRDVAHHGAADRLEQRRPIDRGDHGLAHVDVVERLDLGVHRDPARVARGNELDLILLARQGLLEDLRRRSPRVAAERMRPGQGAARGHRQVRVAPPGS
jgi:hypothetical protein